MRKSGNFFMFLAIVFVLSGCITAVTPKEGPVSLKVGESAPFEVTTFPVDSPVIWKLDNVTISGATARSYVYKAQTAGDYVLSVAEAAQPNTKKSWNIHVAAVVVTDMTTQAQAQDTLFAAYAGIGYMKTMNELDDALFYGVMVNDLNLMTGEFVLQTLFNDPQMVSKLLGILLWSPQTFNYTTPTGIVSSLYIKPTKSVGGCIYFTGTLSLDINSTGFPFGDCTYYGNNGGTDLTAQITGYFKGSSTGLEKFYLHSASITAANTLKAKYSAGQVTYDNWKIDYTTYFGVDDPAYTSGGSTDPINTKIVPVNITLPSSDVDNRDYTVSGVFAFKGNTYTFTSFRYRLQQFVDQSFIKYHILLDGIVKAPGLPCNVAVKADSTKALTRDGDGIWTSGSLSMTGAKNSVNVSFSSAAAGTAACTGSLGSWAVPGWQTLLAPK